MLRKVGEEGRGIRRPLRMQVMGMVGTFPLNPFLSITREPGQGGATSWSQ